MDLYFSINPVEGAADVIEWLAEKSLCTGIVLSHRETPERIAKLVHRGFRIALEFHAHPIVRKRQLRDWGQSDPFLTPGELWNRILAELGPTPRPPIWIGVIENDSSGVGHSQELLRLKPDDHATAHALMVEHMASAMSEARKVPNVEFWGVCGFTLGPHYLAAQGVDKVLLERANDDVEDLASGIAFTRGGARQYGCAWGIDLSLWWGPICGCVHNYEASYHRRHLFISLFSGADSLLVEGGQLLHGRNPDEPRPLEAAIEEVQAFQNKEKLGAPIIPVALVLPHDHGYTPTSYWCRGVETWNYARIPPRPGDRALASFFELAFPGLRFAMEPFPFGKFESNSPPASPFALSSILSPYAPSSEDHYTAPSPLPFGQFNSRIAAREAFDGGFIHPAPYRPMPDSRWGGLFNVYTGNLTAETLNGHQLCLLLGQHDMNAEIWDRLLDFTFMGGSVVLAAGQVGPEDGKHIGIDIMPEFHVGRAWQWGEEAWVHEALHYLPGTCRTETEILARDLEGSPLVTRRSWGKGFIYVNLVPWHGDDGGMLSSVAVRLLDELILPLQPVILHGAPLYWCCTREGSNRQVLLANNSGAAWQGEVEMPGMQDTDPAREMLSGQIWPAKHGKRGKIINGHIRPYDMAAFAFGIKV